MFKTSTTNHYQSSFTSAPLTHQVTTGVAIPQLTVSCHLSKQGPPSLPPWSPQPLSHCFLSARLSEGCTREVQVQGPQERQRAKALQPRDTPTHLLPPGQREEGASSRPFPSPNCISHQDPNTAACRNVFPWEGGHREQFGC